MDSLGLRRSRSACKASVTKVLNELNAIPRVETNTLKVITLIGKLEDAFEKFDTAHGAYCATLKTGSEQVDARAYYEGYLINLRKPTVVDLNG